MRFRISGLSPAPFLPLYGLSDADLAQRGVRRYVADIQSGFPDRIEMRDASAGESVLLVNYLHQPAATPYRSSHAIFVREGAQRAYDGTDTIPEVMRTRMLSLRAFDADHMMLDADLVEGSGAATLIARLFSDPRASYLHAHYARPGCYAGRIDRV